MIWGEIINSVRNLHRDLAEEFHLPVELYSRDLELSPLALPFPEPLDDFDEWLEPQFPDPLGELIPLHPVERALIEGPLLPIQKINFPSKHDIDRLFAHLMSMEKEWMEKTGTSSPDKVQYVENFLVVQSLKLSVRAGFGKISAVKGT